MLATHRAAVRRALARHGGHEIDTAGDGCVATFDPPSAALRCAADVIADAASGGVQLPEGVYLGGAFNDVGEQQSVVDLNLSGIVRVLATETG